MRLVLLLTLAMSTSLVVARHPDKAPRVDGTELIGTGDVSHLLAAARGAHPLLCQLAARATQQTGEWGDISDAPVLPLSGTSDPGRIGKSPMPRAQVEVALAAMRSDDACVRELGARIVSRQQGSEIVAPLLKQLTAPDSVLRALALAVLGWSTPEGATPGVRAALQDAAIPVRANAAWAAGRFEDGAAIAPLMHLTRDDAPLVRRMAVEALGQIDSSRALTTLKNVLRHDGDATVRRTAAWAIGRLDDPAGSSALATALVRDQDEPVREMAAWALGMIESREGAAALDDAIRSDPSAMVRATAAWALGKIELSTATPGLLRGVLDANADVRLKAAWALSQIADKSVAQRLTTALEKEAEPRVQRALLRAVVRTGGENERVLRSLASSSDVKTREIAIRVLVGRKSVEPWPWPWPQPRPRPIP